VQGLRAFAVVAVVLDHLLGWPAGGFVGVDVFFVISGFLITGILIREHARTGSVSFRSFYVRRVKRILPAAVLVLAATLAGSYFLLNAARYSATGRGRPGALVFSANWRFALGSTDYFAQGRPVSPVQQYWSLAVEEQFYVVWPCVLLLVLTLVARRGRSVDQARVALVVVLAALTVLSFGWALWETANVPTAAYFSTLSRTWELASERCSPSAHPPCPGCPLPSGRSELARPGRHDVLAVPDHLGGRLPGALGGAAGPVDGAGDRGRDRGRPAARPGPADQTGEPVRG
jgi:peptidoglycan/LPS O-acetylase OafA/YrhL